MSANLSVLNATKWSAIAEISAKLINPVVNVILARLLTPSMFGIVTTITMIITFAEIFTDSGFQKYIIQHDFKDNNDKSQTVNVAFWTNLIISFIIYLIIIFFSEPLSYLVGNPGLGFVISISCISIPISSLSSIQMALYKRNLDFKTLFKVRIIAILIPLVITVPLAYFLRSYWALVIGSISINISNIFFLFLYSDWRPSFSFCTQKLKAMIGFSTWSMFEQVFIWLTGYVDVFLVGTMLSQHFLGLYKTSSTLVGQIMGLITTATTPILFSALSRLQDNNDEFERIFLKFQKLVSFLVVPMGVIIFLFSDIITYILLGEQWMEASGFIGYWGLTSSLTIVLSHYCSEIFRSKGKPQLSLLAQFLHLIVLLPVVYISVQYGFRVLYISRSLIRFEGIIVNLIILYYLLRISPIKLFFNMKSSVIGSLVIVISYYLMNLLSINIIIEMIICAMLYFITIMQFEDGKYVIRELNKIITKRIAHD